MRGVQQPERVAQAAIRIAGRRIVSVYGIHACSWRRAEEEGLLPDLAAMSREEIDALVTEGFLTNTGRFIDRREAAALALRRHQTDRDYMFYPGQLHFPDIYDREDEHNGGLHQLNRNRNSL